MSNEPKWGVGSNQYKKRPGSMAPGNPEPTLSLVGELPSDKTDACGFNWDSGMVDWGLLAPTNVERSVARFSHAIAGHVWDAAALEGNTFTLPEVQTLLDGVTVGGHRIESELQVLALAAATKELARLVSSGEFEVSRKVTDSLHHIVAQHEALDSGKFRGEGQVSGGGRTVALGELGFFHATAADDGGEALRAEFDSATKYLQESVSNPVEQSLAYFCVGAFRQFYYDGNKRTSRLMMNGMLLASGRDAISIPYSRNLEYNNHLRTLYFRKDATPLMEFILDCRPKP